MVVLTLLSWALASNLAVASPLAVRSAYAVKEVHPVPPAWTRLDRASGDYTVMLDIGLRQNKFDELERHLYEVSDPSHHRYGDHLTQEQVNELVRPSPTTFDLVHEWLAEHGIGAQHLSYSPAQDWVQVALPVSAIERLLDTEYSVFQHTDGDQLVRAPSWSLPAHLHEHITTIQPTNSFIRAAPVSVGVKPVNGKINTVPLVAPLPNAGNSVASACNESLVTPLCLRTLYGTVDYKPGATGKNKVALTDYLKESNNRSDIKLFLETYRPDAAAYAYKFPVQVIAGGNNEQTHETPAQLKAGKDLEGNLDAETIIGITYPTPLQVYTTGGMPPFMKDKNTPTDTNEPYLTWLKFVLNQTDIPQVVSNSYDDDERTVPLSYARAVCNGFAQLGARGVSVFFGSGDSGVGTNGTCFSNTKPVVHQFTPNFPSTCPYITSVGATYKFSPEIVAYDYRNGFASGGGFSNYFPRPSYQKTAVPAYLKFLGNKFNGLYNKTGRAFPDVSAQGVSYITVWDGEGVLLDGTSAATPTVASIISLVNDALLTAGKKPLGFLNPLLYSGLGAAAFNDVVTGSAVGCNGPGFSATKGYDPVSGFGTPNFKKILTYLKVPFNS